MQSPVYSLQSSFDDVVRVHKISRDVWELTRMMKEFAKDYVCRKIGADNFVDTLNSEYKDKPVNECPEGYVLKQIKTNNENYARRLDILFTKRSKGWVSTTAETKLIGYYIIVGVESIDEDIRIPIKAQGVVDVPTTVDIGVRKAWMESIPLFKERLVEIERNRKKKKETLDKAIEEKRKTEDETITAGIVNTFTQSINNSIQLQPSEVVSVPVAPAMPVVSTAPVAPIDKILLGADSDEDAKVKQCANIIVAKVLFGHDEPSIARDDINTCIPPLNVESLPTSSTVEEMSAFSSQIIQQANLLRRTSFRNKLVEREKLRHRCVNNDLHPIMALHRIKTDDAIKIAEEIYY